MLPGQKSVPKNHVVFARKKLLCVFSFFRCKLSLDETSSDTREPVGFSRLHPSMVFFDDTWEKASRGAWEKQSREAVSARPRKAYSPVRPRTIHGQTRLHAADLERAQKSLTVFAFAFSLVDYGNSIVSPQRCLASCECEMTTSFGGRRYDDIITPHRADRWSEATDYDQPPRRLTPTSLAALPRPTGLLS